jgi:adenylyl-sulfate kinase
MKPTVIWLTGLSGAGKTSIANALNFKLRIEGIRSGVADSDTLRLDTNTPVGFNIEGRWKAVNRMIYAVRNMLECQKAEAVIVASISPLIEMRKQARHILSSYSKANFIEVFVDTPLELCEQRDTKGLYKKFRDGLIKDMSGIDSPYEADANVEVWLPYKSPYHGELTVDKAVEIIYNAINNYDKESTTTN